MNRPTSSMTLRQFYDSYVSPICRKAKQIDPKTIALDLAALKHWEALTDDPPLSDIDEYVTAAFVGELSQQPGRRGQLMSPNTVIKHLVHLQYILDRAGPWQRKLGNTARLLSEPPAFPKPKARTVARPALLSLDDMAAWMRAAADAQSPRMPSVDPGRWWKALISVAYNSALRIDCLMRLEWDMLDEETGWLEVPAEIYKGHEHGGTFYLNQAARAALEPLRAWGYKRIFPWRSYPDSSSWLQEQRRRLWMKAGIDLPGCGFHTLRRTVLTWIAGQNDLVARIVAGHAAGNDMLQGHYVNKEKVVPPMLERVPQPVVSDQMGLFEAA